MPPAGGPNQEQIYRNLKGNNITTNQVGRPTRPQPASYHGVGPSRQRQQIGAASNIAAPNNLLPTNATVPVTYLSRPIPPRSTSSNDARSGAKSPIDIFRKGYLALFGSHPQARSVSQSDSNAGALMAEIQRATQIDMSNVVAQFRDLNRDIRTLCDRLGRHASSRKQFPSDVIGNDLDYSAHFRTAEDFIFYGALAILSSRICHKLLMPFHPIMNSEFNHNILSEYEKLSSSGVPLPESILCLSQLLTAFPKT